MFGTRELTRSSEPGAVFSLFFRVVRFAVVCFLMSAVELAAVSAAERAVIILAPAIDDDRLEPTYDAIAFWNETFVALGLDLHLGSPDVIAGVPRAVETYARLIALRAGRLPVPEDLEPSVPAELKQLDADIVLVLSRQNIMSYAWRLPRIESGRHLVVIRQVRGLDRGDPMVSRHVIAHELGHTLGLLHNEESHTLMCGPCQPLAAESDSRGFLPLTVDDRNALRERYAAP